MDSWQRRYFVLSSGELRYYKTEKAAHMSNGESLKAISLDEVLWATVNPRHPDSFVIDLGKERKVKLQASGEEERDAWVAAIEAAKRKHATEKQAENRATNIMSSGSRQPATDAAASARPFGTPAPSGRESGAEDAAAAALSPIQIEAELLRTPAMRANGCCVVS